ARRKGQGGSGWPRTPATSAQSINPSDAWATGIKPRAKVGQYWTVRARRLAVLAVRLPGHERRPPDHVDRLRPDPGRPVGDPEFPRRGEKRAGADDRLHEVACIGICLEVYNHLVPGRG